MICPKDPPLSNGLLIRGTVNQSGIARNFFGDFILLQIYLLTASLLLGVTLDPMDS
jgi:hypothetical protein